MLDEFPANQPVENEEEAPTPRMLTWARNSAAYRLSRRMMTEKQLAEAIAKKAKSKFEQITQAQVAALSRCAIEYGRHIGALDDTAYAEIRTRSGQRAGKSRKAIRQTLKLKGVAADVAEEAVGEADDFLAAIAYARRRAFGPFRRNEPDEKQRLRELSSFARQGFSFDLAQRVLGLDRAEAEEILLNGQGF